MCGGGGVGACAAWVCICFSTGITTTATTTTTTAQITMHAFSICATALGKRPQPPPSHSASYNIMANHHYYHCHHLDHHSKNYNACIQYMCHCFRKKNRPPVQVTVGLAQNQHPSDHRMCRARSRARSHSKSAINLLQQLCCYIISIPIPHYTCSVGLLNTF